MLKHDTERYSTELKDPMLSALLREALSDDPVLHDAPGRTDRIMRKVMASGVRPVRRFGWAPLGWAAGSFATAIAALYLLFTLAHLPLPTVAPQSVPPTVADNVTPVPSAPMTDNFAPNLPVVPVVTPRVPSGTPEVPRTSERARRTWPTPIQRPDVTIARDIPPSVQPATTAESQAQVVSALNSAGATASDLGDYATAYHAYAASYDVTPTPDALLASGTALQLLAEEAMEAGNLST